MHTIRQPLTIADSRVGETSGSGKWMVLLAAFLGWMFDGFEMGLFPLIGGPAPAELLGPSAHRRDRPSGSAESSPSFSSARRPAACSSAGWAIASAACAPCRSSIFTYAIFTGLCGFATEAWHIAILRFVASLGMGGEWSFGVALVNEIWPGKSRAVIAGLIGAAANVGFLLVAY